MNWLKKNLVSSLSGAERRGLVEREEPELPLSVQAELLSVSRSSLYYQPMCTLGGTRWSSNTASTKSIPSVRSMGAAASLSIYAGKEARSIAKLCSGTGERWESAASVLALT